MYSLCKENTLSYQILEMIGISGEFPSAALTLFSGGEFYKEKIITDLKEKKLVHTYYKNQLRGYRLSLAGKKLLLNNNPERFNFFLQGQYDTNHLPNDIRRRLRLHSIAEVYLLMKNAGVHIFRDEKSDIFQPASDDILALRYRENAENKAPPQPLSGEPVLPSFYNSREFKQLGNEVMKMKNARAAGLLLTESNIYAVYNAGNYVLKWDLMSEMRLKVIVQQYLCQNRFPNLYLNKTIKAIVFGSGMDMAARLMASAGGNKRNYFMLDDNYDNFYFLPGDSNGELLIKLFCDASVTERLNKVLLSDFQPANKNLTIENDALDTDGNPVLLAYDFDMQRIARFKAGLILLKKKGTIICFDFQYDVLDEYFGENTDVKIQKIDAIKFRKAFLKPSGTG